MTKTGKIILSLVIIILAMVLIYQGVISFYQSANSNKTIKIGVIPALTGKGSAYGEMTLKGAEIAAEEINQQAGYEKIKLVIEDSQSDNTAAISSYEKIKLENAQTFITGISGVVLTLAPLANQDQLVMLNVSAQSPKIRMAGDYVFSNINDSTVEVADMAKFIIEQGQNKTAIFYENADAGVGAKDVFKTSIQALGGEVVTEVSFTGKATDVKSQLLKLKKLQPEAVYLPAYPENVGYILKQAKELNFQTNWYSWNIEGPEVVNLAGKASDGIIYTSTTFDPESSDQKINKFKTHFYAKYQIMPNIYAATAYDGIKLLAEAIDKTKNESNSIINYLMAVKNWSGVSGITSFDQDGMVKKPTIFKTIKDGEFVNYQ